VERRENIRQFVLDLVRFMEVCSYLILIVTLVWKKEKKGNIKRFINNIKKKPRFIRMPYFLHQVSGGRRVKDSSG
jgi:hypothetical protein